MTRDILCHNIVWKLINGRATISNRPTVRFGSLPLLQLAPHLRPQKRELVISPSYKLQYMELRDGRSTHLQLTLCSGVIPTVDMSDSIPYRLERIFFSRIPA
jgi:hypothetical protein